MAIIVYTTAHEVYDGFGTKHIKVVGKYFNEEVRKVEVVEKHLDWQVNRYHSGMNIATEDWLEMKDYIDSSKE